MSLNHYLGSFNFNDVKLKAATLSNSVKSSLQANADNVVKYIKNEHVHKVSSSTNVSHASNEFSQTVNKDSLKWPVLINNKRHWLPFAKRSSEDEEEDIVDKFIRVIQLEDEEERPQETFYNHPERRVLHLFII